MSINAPGFMVLFISCKFQAHDIENDMKNKFKVICIYIQ